MRRRNRVVVTGMGVLAPTEVDRHLDLVTVPQEVLDELGLELQVVFADLRLQAHFLEGDRALPIAAR